MSKIKNVAAMEKLVNEAKAHNESVLSAEKEQARIKTETAKLKKAKEKHAHVTEILEVQGQALDRIIDSQNTSVFIAMQPAQVLAWTIPISVQRLSTLTFKVQ